MNIKQILVVSLFSVFNVPFSQVAVAAKGDVTAIICYGKNQCDYFTRETPDYVYMIPYGGRDPETLRGFNND